MFSAKHYKNSKTPENIKIGQFGEGKACEYLVEKGYIIVNKNVKERHYEIDIIAMDPSGILVFIEVKTLKTTHLINGLSPEDNASSNKLRKIRNAAVLFSNKNPSLINDELGWRI